MRKAELIQKIKELDINPKDYIVIGSGLLGALGIREVDDIDLVLGERVFRQLELSRDWERKDYDDGSYYLIDGILEIGLDWDSKDALPNLNDLKSSEVIVESVPFVGPDRLMSWKKKKGRPKDLEDIKLLEAYLKG